MKQIFTRALALILLLAMSTLSLFSCAVSENGEKTDGIPSDLATVEEETTDPAKTLDTPDLDFGSYQFAVQTIAQDDFFTLFDTEGYNGDPVNDAIYERNRLIEKKYNVQFYWIESGLSDSYNTLRNQVTTGLTGDEAFDLIMLICRDAYSQSLNGYLCDYANLEYVDVNKDYYFRSINDQFTVGGRTFFAYSAEALNVLTQTCIMIYDKQIATDHQFENFYDRVRNMTWTYDVLFARCRDVLEDVDNDGKYTLEKDTLGLSGRLDFTYPNAWVAAGEKFISKDENDLPYYSASGNQRMIDAMQAMLGFFQENGNNINLGSTPLDAFRQNKIFILTGGATHLGNIKDMKDDFGVLPWPLYDESQTRYYARLYEGWVNTVPSNCEDTARTSAIMQALGYYSDLTVYDAYYSMCLTSKYVRDPDSVEMLKLILSSTTVDLADTVWYSNMRLSMTSDLTGKNGANRVTSVIKQYEKVADKNVREVTKFLEKQKKKAG